MSNIRSSPDSSKVVPQWDPKNATSSFVDLNVSVDSSILSPCRDRTEKTIKGSLSTWEESTTNYYLLLERLE